MDEYITESFNAASLKGGLDPAVNVFWYDDHESLNLCVFLLVSNQSLYCFVTKSRCNKYFVDSIQSIKYIALRYTKTISMSNVHLTVPQKRTYFRTGDSIQNIL